MQTYMLRRLLMLIPVLLGVSILVFGLLSLTPGDIADQLADVTEEAFPDVDPVEIREFFGLDEPVHVQFGKWLWGVVRGDLGKSFLTDEPVLKRILDRTPVTLELAILSTALGLAIGITAGIIAAIRQDSGVDYVSRVIGIIGLAIPNFYLAILFLLIPSLLWGWAPPFRYHELFEEPVANLRQMAFPTIVIGTALSAGMMRMTRSTMLEVLRQDYVRTAHAKGLTENKVITRHVLKNAMIPVVTIFGNHMANAFSGSIIAEQIFGLPGIGRLVIDSINQRDYPQLQGTVLFFAFTVVIVNLITDLSYAWLDPRIRYK